MSCLVIGDSIAVGVGAAMPECVTEARVGITSAAYLRQFRSEPTGTMVISLGANDGAGTDDAPTLRRLRAQVRAARVIWVLPARPASARTAIATVSAEYGDRLVDSAPWAGPDGMHPGAAGYLAIAREIYEGWGDRG